LDLPDERDARAAVDALAPGESSRARDASGIAGARARVWSLVGAVGLGIVLARWLPEWLAAHPTLRVSALPAWAWFCGALACGGASAGVCALVNRRDAIARASSRRAWHAVAWRVAGLAGMLALAAGWTTARVWEAPARDVSRVLGSSGGAGPMVVRVEGVVRGAPTPTRPPEGALAPFRVREPGWTFTLAVRRLIDDTGGSIACTGGVRVLVAADAPPGVRGGQGVAVTGIFVPLERATNPGEEDPAPWSRQEGLSGTLRVSSAALVERAPHAASLLDAVRGAIASVREALRARARSVLGLDRRTGQPIAGPTGAPGRALAGALLLGERTPREEWGEAFTRLGLSHVLSISGFHLTVMAAVALWAMRLTGDRGMLEPLIVGALVVAYALMVPPASPVLRSALMVLALLLGEALGRRYDRVCVLGWIVVALLAWRPLDLFSLGFQLSCGLTALLLWASGPLVDRLGPARVRGVIEDAPIRARLLRGVRDGALAGAMCWLVAAPMVAHATGLFSPLGILATMLVAPIIVLALWVGYAMLLAGMIVPALGGIARGVLWSLGDASAWLASCLDGLPGSAIVVAPVPLWWALLATSALALWARFGGLRTPRGVAIVIVLGASLAIAWVRGAGLPDRVAVRVDMLDVGDGTSVLVRSGGDAVLWDAQRAPARGVLEGVVRSVRALGVHRVRRVVITHPDIDHFAGLPGVLGPLGVREVLVPERFIEQAARAPGGAADTMLRELAGRRASVRAIGAGEVLMIGRARMTVLSPVPGAQFAEDNDHSLVALVEAPRAGATRPARVLLTGDVGPGAIAALARRVAPERLTPIDAIELPHHGSARPEPIEWVRRLSPRVVMQSSGPTRVGDPRWGVVRDSATLHAWLVTARDGAVGVEFWHDGGVRAGASRGDG
jgi:competence protein ComEC